MSDNEQGPPVTFRVRYGRDTFACRGFLLWEGGICYAVADPADDYSAYVPDRVRLEERDLELKHDAASGHQWYQYHGFIVVPYV